MEKLFLVSRKKIFDNIWIQPLGDAKSLGAALAYWHHELAKPNV